MPFDTHAVLKLIALRQVDFYERHVLMPPSGPPEKGYLFMIIGKTVIPVNNVFIYHDCRQVAPGAGGVHSEADGPVLSRCHSLIRSLSISLTRSLAHSLTLSRPHSLTLSLSHSHALTLSLSLTLSLDRSNLVREGFIPKLVDLLKKPQFRHVSLKLLYHISMDDKCKSMFTYTDCIPMVLPCTLHPAPCTLHPTPYS